MRGVWIWAMVGNLIPQVSHEPPVFPWSLCLPLLHQVWRSLRCAPPTRWGLPLASVRPRSGVCTSAPTHLPSRSASKTKPLCPGLPFQSRIVSKTSTRWPGLPLRACVPHSGVCTSASTHLCCCGASKTMPPDKSRGAIVLVHFGPCAFFLHFRAHRNFFWLLRAHVVN
jgi:hypothetical protein